MSRPIRHFHPLRSGNRIRLHPRLAQAWGIAAWHRCVLVFGQARRSVDVEQDAGVPEGEIQVGQPVLDDLRIPDYVPLKAEIRGRSLLIGPYAGILMGKEDAELDERYRVTRKRYRTERLGSVTFHTPIGHFGFVQQYRRLGGAVVLFALDKVDAAARTLEGYCYDPASDSWRPGTFPYPGSLYRRVGLSETWKAHFLTAMGDTGFNSYYADKWEVARWLGEDPALGEHLPETRLYKSFEDLRVMVERHGRIYAKPASGMGGHGVMRVEQDGPGLRFAFREGEVNHELRYAGTEARVFADERLGQVEHLVQQGIDLRTYEGSVLDVRLLMQKEWGDAWICEGIIIRQGVSGSVVSNISSGGCAWTIDELFVDRLSFPVGRARALGARLEALGVAVCDRLDRAGVRLAYVGVDVGIDASDRLWIIEVNMRDPDSTIALDVNDKRLYDRLKINPLIHGAWLSGFTPEEGGEP